MLSNEYLDGVILRARALGVCGMLDLRQFVADSYVYSTPEVEEFLNHALTDTVAMAERLKRVNAFINTCEKSLAEMKRITTKKGFEYEIHKVKRIFIAEAFEYLKK